MRETIVSVIVPVFNGEKFIEKCVQSVLCQTFTNLQIIVVDDGSTDQTFSILEKLSYRDSRLQLLHQENGGVSRARNSGLAAATGEWVLFVDADDMILNDYCETMVRAASNMNVDVLIARPHQSGEDDCIKLDEKKKLIEACLSYDERRFSYNIDAPWGKLFRLSVVQDNNIRFPEELTRSEDAYFCMDCYRCAQEIGLLNQFGYVHTEREGSLCKSYSPNAPEMLEKIINVNAIWVQKYYSRDKDMERALWFRVLPGVVECEKQYFLHPKNTANVLQKARCYQKMLAAGIIAKAIYAVKVSYVEKLQLKIRLMLYKLHLGWLLIIFKRK